MNKKTLFAVAVLCLTLGCANMEAKKDREPDSDIMLHMSFNTAWSIVRDCIQEQNLPTKKIDKINGVVHTKKISRGIGYTGFSLSIEVNNLNEQLNKVYIDGSYSSAHPFIDPVASNALKKEIRKLNTCITEKSNAGNKI